MISSAGLNGAGRKPHRLPAASTAITLTFLVPMLGSAPASAEPLFNAVLDFDTATSPANITVGDLNGDQNPDVVTGEDGLGWGSVLLGNGNGTFAPWTVLQLSVPADAHAVAIGDLNGDGKLDLAVTRSGFGVVSVLLGNGDGTFGAPTDHATGSSPRSVAIGDVSGDESPDLVVANRGSNTVSVLLGNGDGTFGASTDYATGNTPRSVAIGDLNGDASPDLVVANQDANTVSVLLGNGGGTFGPKTDFMTGTQPCSVAVGDLNVDGQRDLVVGNAGSNTVSLLLGNGDGTFAAKTDFAAGANHPYAVAIGDLNGDQKPDLVVGKDGTTLSILLGNGDGTFGVAVEHLVGNGPTSVAVADVNRDGKPDLEAANYNSNAVSVLLGKGDGTFVTRAEYETGLSPNSVAIGNLSADGSPDLVVTNHGSNTVSVLLGNGDGTVGMKTDFETGSGPNSVAVADLSGDGKADLAVANLGDYPTLGNTVSVLLGSGDGTFGPKTDFLAGIGPCSIVAGDLNGDGKRDLAVANRGSSTVSVLLGNGDGTFGPKTDYVTGDPWNVTVSVAIGDLNGDGNLDLAVANEAGVYCGEGQLTAPDFVEWLLGNGDGTFRAPAGYSGELAAILTSVAIEDLNGDGNQDLILGDYLDSGGNACPPFGAATVLLGNGDGTFVGSTDFPSGGDPASVAIGDLNGDGIADLVTANRMDDSPEYRTGNTVSVLIGNGDGTFGARADFGTGISPWSVAIGDLNGDGRLDLVTADMSSNTVSVLLGLPQVPTGVEPVSAPRVHLSASVVPNPLNSAGVLRFSTSRSGPVKVAVFDAQGRLVRALMDTASLPIGSHAVPVEARGDRGQALATGVYFSRVETVEGSVVGKIAILK